ncbi:unnamed protein product [Trichobilharzia regenti]|nr:unnamed protein product [Trichobilharzia regenti]
MFLFFIYSSREAQYLVPTDSRLIVALGEIYEKLNRLDEAKKCYWRAYCVGDIEGGALIRLAACFEKCCEDAEAAAAYTEFIKLGHRYGVSFIPVSIISAYILLIPNIIILFFDITNLYASYLCLLSLLCFSLYFLFLVCVLSEVRRLELL